MPNAPSDLEIFPTPPQGGRPASLRSGTAARLAGLPVATLRVWERRYGVVPATRTDRGQRLYSSHDVARLRLLRQLTQRGHAIGSIAGLDLAPLQALGLGAPASSSEAPASVMEAPVRARVVGVGAGLGARLAACCKLVALREGLDDAEQRPPASVDPEASDLDPEIGPDVLVVRVGSLHEAECARILALAAAWQARSTLVLYAFGTEANARSLRIAGATARREPIADIELLQTVRALGAASRAAPAAPMPGPADAQARPRRFSDEALAALANMPSPVECECLRHLSEIVGQLAAFERYSLDCPSTGAADADLHRQLSGLAGAARTQFENALQRVVTQAGLTVETAR